MNLLDRAIAAVFPRAGLRRMHARYVLSQYDAAKPSRLRKGKRDQRSPDLQVQQGAVALRDLARNLEQNHDIFRGALRTMVNNIVGPNGIGIEPQPRRADGTIHEEYARALKEVYRDWCKCPEVTHKHHWSKVQRLGCASWLRDGEFFAQRLRGAVPLLDHGTTLPYSLELFEADLVPFDHYDEANRVQQGIERNAWGRATAIWCYKEFPNGISFLKRNADLKRIPMANVLHVASIDRIGQMRGVSIFASVITRLEDIKEYEESERIAAKVAASLTAYVRRGAPEDYDVDRFAANAAADNNSTDIAMSPGMVIKDLKPGEDIGMIDSNRPNPNLITFRSGQLRAVAAGIGASYSSISRDYNGTYSAQRQELVEQWVHYAVAADDFVGQFVQPVWEDIVQIAHLSGAARIPKDVVPSTASDALYVGQAMPWIDPMKEALAWTALVQAGFASEVEVMRKRGANPHDVLEQINQYRTKVGEMKLVFSADFANVRKLPAAPAREEPPEDSGNDDVKEDKENEQTGTSRS
ncbi:phage portal protein [Pseudoduganella sp. FT55W]|uniref:Phage portal protein n=1 Tax=Duganella rivi TaxID=2666083 RepID=A0A7X4K9U2_9BURK|nr:phage portal protein [Duganella rivi]MYM65440.1 phage portal protein [Duganella rivi]